MASYTARKSSGPVLRSISPSPRHYSTQPPPFASASSAFSTTTPRTLRRPTTPSLYNYTSPSLNFSMQSSGSTNRSISVRSTKPGSTSSNPPPKRSCMCSPTNHPGSFRCSLHKAAGSRQTVSCNSSSGLNMRRSAMKNSLVRIGTVEGDLVKRALAALIRPSSHNQRRRGEFRPRPSRLSVVSTA